MTGDDLAQLRDDYRAGFEQYCSGKAEKGLLRAYELGRHALGRSLGILDVTALHHDVLNASLEDCSSCGEAHERVRAAAEFLAEALSPFEMSHRAVDEANTTLQNLNQILEEEARRIGYALHDEAGALLASAGVAVARASRNLSDAERERLTEARRMIEQIGEQLREYSHELRPPLLDDEGLTAALADLARSVGRRTGMDIRVRGRIRQRLPWETEVAIYRVAQEALNNAARHAGATSVTIGLGRRAGRLWCVIADNGVGFDVNATLADRERRGLGLMGMRERINAVGGVLAIRSAPREGTSVDVHLPLEAIK